jgi:tetratricopeptide (TPR) repeat protein
MPVLYLQDEDNGSLEHSSAVALREELLSQLSRLPLDQLVVLAPNSAKTFEQVNQLDHKLIYQLTGTIRQDPLHSRIDMRLTNERQQQLWSESFVYSHGAGMPVFQSLAKDILGGVYTILNVSPVSVATSQVALASPDLRVYNEGLYLASQFSGENTRKAIEKFRLVLDNYPHYVPAIIQLAKLYNTLASQSIQSQEKHFSLAMQYAKQAIELDVNSAEAYFVLAYAQLYHEWQFAASRQSLNKGLSISPNNGFARSLNAALLASQNRMTEAVNEAKLAKRLDPLSLTVNADLCWYLNFARQFAQAEVECANILNVEPQSFWTRLGLAEALTQQRKVSEAAQQYKQLFNLTQSPEAGNEKDFVDHLLKQWLKQLRSAYVKGQAQAYSIAALYSQLNDKDNAMIWLKKAYEDSDGFIVFVGVDPRFDALRDELSFQTLLNKLEIMQ